MQLLLRDGGVCSICGVNAQQMDRALSQLKSDLLHPLLMTIHPMIVTTLRSEGWTNVRARGRGSYPDAIAFTSCWEAHHAKAVIEGGGECGLDNYRTVCFICHKRMSAELARTRAEARRARKKQLLQQPKTKAATTVPSLLNAIDDDEIPF